jgi:inhibitor of cysteine peptidase
MSTVVLTEVDNGGSVALSVGDLLQIRLFENPTTGYRWEIEAVNQSILAERGVTSEGAVNPAPGAGRYISFLFGAEQAGATQLHLRCWQRWEGNVDQRFSTTILVRG